MAEWAHLDAGWAWVMGCRENGPSPGHITDSMSVLVSDEASADAS